MTIEPLIADDAAPTQGSPVIEVRHLSRAFGRSEAVRDLTLSVRPGSVYGFFRAKRRWEDNYDQMSSELAAPTSGTVRLFGIDPGRNEVAVKRRLAYVPDSAAFYPWMTVRSTLDYFASFRDRWDAAVEAELLERFRLDPAKRVSALSKGQTMQLALATAICPGPELLILDEPTTGLDPIVRREFVEAVVGAYQDAGPEERTIFVSTHLISEFEGLVDHFTIIENGRTVLTSGANDVRDRFRRLRARFPGPPPALDVPHCVERLVSGRELELVVSDDHESAVQRVALSAPECVSVEALDLETIFVTLLRSQKEAM